MHSATHRFISRALAGLLATGAVLVSNPTLAVIPAKDAAHDELGIAINAAAGDLYTLPAGKKIFHGTRNPFKAFSAKIGPYATWFSTSKETSEAMGYYRWCSSAKHVGAGLETGKNVANLTHEQTEAIDASGWPSLMNIDVKQGQSLNLLLIPYGKAGHLDQFKKVGYDMKASTNGKLKALASLYAAGSSAGMMALQESELCDVKVWVDAHHKIVAHQKGSGAVVGKQTGTAIQLDGWRAPWDQNELAVCKAAVVRALEVVGAPEKLSGATHLVLEPLYKKVSKALGTGNKAVKLQEIVKKATDPAHKDATDYSTHFISAAKQLCDETADTHPGSLLGDSGNTFDIVFVKKAHPATHLDVDKHELDEVEDEGELANK